ncbi:MAG: hypothetical protein J6K51_01680 [Clostridia bacterium]|nr:hypothetical protein [Clostridia bacterium]
MPNSSSNQRTITEILEELTKKEQDKHQNNTNPNYSPYKNSEIVTKAKNQTSIENKKYQNETSQISTSPKQTSISHKTDFILPICTVLFLIVITTTFIKQYNKSNKGENNISITYQFDKKIKKYQHPTKWLQFFVKIHPMITFFSTLACVISLISSVVNSEYTQFLATLFDVGTVILAILVMVHIKSATPKAYKLTMAFFGYLLTLSSIILVLYLFLFFINYEDLLFAMRYPNYNPELLTWFNEIISTSISSLGYILYCILNICYFYKRKSFFELTPTPQKIKAEKERNKKNFMKNMLIYLWLIYIIAQFCFFVPFKTFAPGYEKTRYTGTVIKTLWYDEPYTQINFPLLLTQAGVVTVVLGTICYTLSQKHKESYSKNYDEISNATSRESKSSSPSGTETIEFLDLETKELLPKTYKPIIDKEIKRN